MASPSFAVRAFRTRVARSGLRLRLGLATWLGFKPFWAYCKSVIATMGNHDLFFLKGKSESANIEVLEDS